MGNKKFSKDLFPQVEDANKKYDIRGIRAEMETLADEIGGYKDYLTDRPHTSLRAEDLSSAQTTLLDKKFRYTQLCMARAHMRGRIHTRRMLPQNGHPGFSTSFSKAEKAFEFQGEFISKVLEEFEYFKEEGKAYTTKHRKKNPTKYDDVYVTPRDLRFIPQVQS